MRPFELSQRLAELTGPERASAYREALDVHFWLWRWLRTSDRDSLAYLRNVLLDHELVEPSPDAAWVVDRSLAQVSAAFGAAFTSQFDEIVFKALSGQVPPQRPEQWIDSGAGNGATIYEATRPWLQGVGTGLALVFDVGGTLRNWLREPLRGGDLRPYGSELLEAALKCAEIHSVARYARGWPDGDALDPLAPLEAAVAARDGAVSGDLLAQTLDAAGAEIDRLRPRETDPDRLVAATALGFLLDALAGRAAVPNGMQFWYGLDELAPDLLNTLASVVEQRAPQCRARQEVAAAGPELQRLARCVERHLSQEAPVAADREIRASLPALGDRLRQAGFELRERGAADGLVEGLHAVGNGLWRWHFFLVDFDRWEPRPSVTPSSSEARDVIRRWLERPWGVLRIDDMKIALGSSPAEPAAPALMGPLVPLMRGGVAPFLADAFPGEPEAERSLLAFVSQRCRLHDLRRSIRSVTHKESEESELAALLVDLLVSWFYDRSERERQRIAAERLEPLRDALMSGAFIGELEELQLLSRRQAALLDRYRNAPAATTRALFEFDDASRLPDRLDVFPPEEFWVGNMAEL